jgi:hypothetical protein
MGHGDLAEQVACQADELHAILKRSRLTGWRIEEAFMDLVVVRSR